VMCHVPGVSASDCEKPFQKINGRCECVSVDCGYDECSCPQVIGNCAYCDTDGSCGTPEDCGPFQQDSSPVNALLLSGDPVYQAATLTLLALRSSTCASEMQGLDGSVEEAQGSRRSE
jgi:hypothetical protein